MYHEPFSTIGLILITLYISQQAFSTLKSVENVRRFRRRNVDVDFDGDFDVDISTSIRKKNISCKIDRHYSA